MATLFYTFVEDMGTKRAPHRPAHLAHTRAAEANGDLLLVGPCSAVASSALLLCWVVTVVFTQGAPERLKKSFRWPLNRPPHVVHGFCSFSRLQGGAFADLTGGMLLFKDAGAAEAFALADP